MHTCLLLGSLRVRVQVRSDKNLSELRTSPKFEKLINSYDEPVINWEAINNTFGAFGKLFKKDK